MQDNAHFAHPENIAIAYLSDPDEEIRRKGVNYILQARKDFNEEDDIRKFIPPNINFKSQHFSDLVDLESGN